ncbi:MAG: polysaccharide biosynthesis C-terminal domain-containing protein [Paludibacteraceae bacterium]|nr:polysaccharide biosynthesis C-terminal domain-containing protein [Paludibacteraceae bacterium]
MTTKEEIKTMFTRYLISAVLTSLTTALAVMVDGIIVGNLIGHTGLAAINIMMPFIQLSVALIMLLCTGGALLAAYGIGQKNYNVSNGYFTMSTILTLAVGFIFTTLGIICPDACIKVFCSDPALFPDAKAYGVVMFYTAPLFFMIQNLAAYIRTDNSPRLVLTAMIIANVINLTCDYIYIKFFGMGIGGAAWATATGYALALALMCIHFTYKDSTLRLNTNFKEVAIVSLLTMGLPLVADTATMFARVLWVNHIIMDTLPQYGMSIMAVLMAVLMFMNMVVAGTSQALQPLAGRLGGEGNKQGVRWVVKMSAIVLIVSGVALVIIVNILASPIARLFGLSGECLELTIPALRIFCICFPFFGISYLLFVICLIQKRKTLSCVLAVTHSFMVAPVMWCIVHINPDLIWHSFWIGDVLAVAVGLILYRIYNVKITDERI